jgi:cytochrome c biogenesis protein CcdA
VPLGKVSQQRIKWAEMAALFTASGAASSILVGAVAAGIGRLVGLNVGLSLPLLTAWTVLLGLRHLDIVPVPLPSARRQTASIWARMLGDRGASVLWGVDIGLSLSTRITYSGPWLVLVASVLSQDVAFSVTLVTSYWFGRAASVWLAPFATSSATSTPKLFDDIELATPAFDRAHMAAIIAASGLLTLGILLRVPFP